LSTGSERESRGDYEKRKGKFHWNRQWSRWL
jgi:hypothetical protein